MKVVAMKAHSLLIGACVMAMTGLPGCAPDEPNALDKLGIVPVRVKDLSVRAWMADEREERTKGLMFVTAQELSPLAGGDERGMLFVFERDETGGFWMKNTIIDLDIAFIRQDGVIVDTFTMAALDERSYTPRSPYRYALEVRAGVFEREGVVVGDNVDISQATLKRNR